MNAFSQYARFVLFGDVFGIILALSQSQEQSPEETEMSALLNQSLTQSGFQVYNLSDPLSWDMVFCVDLYQKLLVLVNHHGDLHIGLERHRSYQKSGCL